VTNLLQKNSLFDLKLYALKTNKSQIQWLQPFYFIFLEKTDLGDFTPK
jgi:hypothetical protein